MENIFEQYESNVRSYCRHFPAVFEYAKGATMTDEEGRTYIDFFCGAGALNYGHNNDYIKNKLIAYLQEDRLLHGMDMYSPAKRDFISFMQEKVLKPKGLNYKIQFVAPTGTNAVEASLKLARKVTGRTNIFALMGAFHGMTLGSLALTSDLSDRAGAGVPLHDVTHIPAPYMFPELDTIAYMERLLTDDHSGVSKPAAIIFEPLQSDGGIYPMPVEWMQRVRDLCNRHGILMICDDIQIGNNRSGSFFSFERAGVVPDMVTVSKSIGGMGMPCSILLLKPELDIWKPGEHNGTFRGNQLAFVTAKAGLEYMLENDVAGQVRKKEAIVSEYLEKEILPLDNRLQVRGLGLMWGI
ncbi:MAG: diaminobutyrate--2-oxoglutarate transaminase, partial [Oscillospiraceae bacterium]|nr:diaminobutyrate--2-oxoglutarate transaminase [Oscillospiraceae bacterium]